MQVSRAKTAAQDWLRAHDAASVAPELLLRAGRPADTARLRREGIESAMGPLQEPRPRSGDNSEESE